MIYQPALYDLINAAKLMDADLFDMGFAQLAGLAISVVSGELWHEYYASIEESKMKPTSPQAFINGQPIASCMVMRTVYVTKPRYARLPQWMIRALAWLGVATTDERQVEVLELKDTPPAGTHVTVMYQTTFGE